MILKKCWRCSEIPLPERRLATTSPVSDAASAGKFPCPEPKNDGAGSSCTISWSVVARACLLSLILASPAGAWAPEGHRIVAAVAERHLSPEARAQVNELLKGHSLASVSSWADQVRRTRPETYNWHFVDIPLEMSQYEATRDCRSSPRGDCVVAAINRGVETLKDARVTGPARVQALMFLVHFVGDIHQPLHASEGVTANGTPDRGGNLIAVNFYGHVSNLHRVWDGELLAHSGQRQASLVAELRALAETFPAETFSKTSAATWANEAHREARAHAYGDLPRTFMMDEASLGDAYERAELPTVKRQLALAGYHLAVALNAAFSTQK